VPGCDQTFIASSERDAHERRPHTAGHGRIATETPFDCFECSAPLHSKAALRRHAKEMQHQPYACECGSQFSRLDVLNRHLESFDTREPEFPCKYCKLHRGADGFRRKDHLMQHIRNYHHHEIDVNFDTNDGSGSSPRLKYSFPVCSHEGCHQYRTDAFKNLPRSVQEADKPFASQAAYTKHMREEHNETAFPCDIQGCSRIGRRGYSREKDLIKHRREHADAPVYVVSARDLRHKCTEPGCNDILDPSSLKYHYDWHHSKQKMEEHGSVKEHEGLVLGPLPVLLENNDASILMEPVLRDSGPISNSNAVQRADAFDWGLASGAWTT
jgi:hypothetical protein